MDDTGAAQEPGVHDDDVVGALVMMSRAMVALSMRNLEQVDSSVTLQQFRTLVTLVSGPTRVSDLARSLRVQSSTMTRMCDRLARKGLVSRHERIDDRRAVWVSLTAAGCELTGLGMRNRHAEIAEIVAGIDAAQPAGRLIEAFAIAAGEITNDEWWRNWAALETADPEFEAPYLP